MKARLLTETEVDVSGNMEWFGYGTDDWLKPVLEAQLEVAHLHYMGVVREIFEALNKQCTCEPVCDQRFANECPDCFEEIESRFLGGA